jgi:hypothetical protein
MDIHPFAELFPMLKDDELAELVMDIGMHGLRNPITLYDEKVLDGRNRQRACELAGVEPIYDHTTAPTL